MGASFGNSFVQAMVGGGGGGGPSEPGGEVAAGGRVFRSASGPANSKSPGGHFDAATSGPGGAVPYKARMEQAFGQDFSGVSAHTGQSEALSGIGARAAARGEAVAFSESSPSVETVAHELTHVVQAREGGGGVQGEGGLSSPGEAAEVEASAVAARVARGEPAGAISAPAGGVLRDPEAGVAGGEAGAEGGTSEEEAGECVSELDGLRQAVGDGDVTSANNHFYALSDDEKIAVRDDTTGLLTGYLELIDDRDVPYALDYLGVTASLRLELAALYCGEDPQALAGVLADLGIVGSADLALNAGEIAGLTPYHDPAILEPIVRDGDANGQLDCLLETACVGLLRAVWPDTSALSLLDGLLSQDDLVLAAWLNAEHARAWLQAYPTDLSDLIINAAQAERWVVELGVDFVNELELLIMQDPYSWGAGICGTAAVQGEMLAPGSQLADVLVYALSEYNAAEAVAAMQDASWLDMEILITADGGGWLDPALADTIVNSPTATAESQSAIARDPTCAAALQAQGVHPLDILVLLAADEAQMAAAFAVPEFNLWMMTDEARTQAYVAAVADKAPWAQVMVDGGQVALLVKLAHGDETWRAGVDANNLIEDVLNKVAPVGDQESFIGLYNLLGDATARSRAQNDLAYAKLIQVRRLAAGQMIDVVYGEGSHNATIGGVAMSWDLGSTPIPLEPSDKAIAEFLNTMKTVPRSLIMATNTLIFAAEEECYWWQTSPASSTAWHPWAPTLKKRVATSYAGDGVVTIQAYKAGDKVDETRRAANGAVSDTGLQLTMNEGDIDPTQIRADTQTGTGWSTGGGEDRTATGGDDNETVPGGLTYFQNHARHEFGHSVGEQAYQGVSSTGNAFAEAWGGWSQTGTSVGYARTLGWTTAMDTTNYTVTDAAGTTSVTAAGSLFRDFLTSIASNGWSGASASNTLVDSSNAALFSSNTELIRAIAGHATLSATLLFRTLRAGLMSFPGEGYSFVHGVTGPAKVTFFSTRWGNRWVQYDKTALNKARPALGWYSLSSPVEMFAEAFTSKYSGGGVPAANNSKDWGAFFTSLEASPGVAAPTAGPAIRAAPRPGAGAGETPPPRTVF
jgi:hypothetical protein